MERKGETTERHGREKQPPDLQRQPVRALCVTDFNIHEVCLLHREK